MPNMKIERLISKQPPAARLQGLYDRGYYYGENSGYSTRGYQDDHPDWVAWCDFLHSLKPPGGRLIDLGCAYGFLVEEWRRRGQQAFGLDISPYALRRGHGGGALAQSTLGQLPLADACADIVCLFDVLEHLHDPLAALREARRLLRPRGLLIGATPDAPSFPRQEETHVFERPASFWVAALEELGLQCRFRFSEVDYNFQFLAGEAPQLPLLGRLQHDFFGEAQDVLNSTPPLAAVLRPDWGPLLDGMRKLDKRPARVYLLNPCNGPLKVQASVRLRCRDWAGMRVRWNSQVLADIHPGAEPVDDVLRLPEFLLPSGGHHLFFESSPAEAHWEIGELGLQARAADPGPLRRGLPFDLYQRYRMAADAARVLAPRTLLDMGGYIGDADGHLAVPADFFAPESSQGPPQVLSCDERLCDHPDHLSSDDPLLEEAGFDMVVCLDVLEHVPSQQRPGFLARLHGLARRWIVLAGPFASPQVEDAEERLRQGLMSARRFLQEHAQFGLPQLEAVSEFFSGRGCQVLDFPNGYLPHWLQAQALSQHYFALDDYSCNNLFNRILNRCRYRYDLREPAYRRLLLISKEPLAAPQEEQLSVALQGKEEDAPAPLLSQDPRFLELQERVIALVGKRRQPLGDAYFLLNERHKHIGLLKDTVQELERLNAQPLHKIAVRRLREKR